MRERKRRGKKHAGGKEWNLWEGERGRGEYEKEGSFFFWRERKWKIKKKAKKETKKKIFLIKEENLYEKN